jgi:riboflavin kinase / FMN adenylyltransferase
MNERETVADLQMPTATLALDETPPAWCRDGALSIGNFDGVHRGHAALLAELRRQAGTAGGPAVAVTFDPHPLQLLRPERFEPVLTTLADRAELLQFHGADHVVILRTTPVLLQLTAADFFARVIRTGFRARAVVEGINFGFGRNREGTIETLANLCAEAALNFTVVPALHDAGTPVSSSRVRSCLVRGAVREAAALLGRPYRLRGVVGKGQARGQTLGFPTANLEHVATLVPGDGVYAVRVRLADGSCWPAAANIGANPTFAEQARKLEVHLIGFAGDIYGQELAVDFVERLRETTRFTSAAALVEQLGKDVSAARHLLEK